MNIVARVTRETEYGLETTFHSVLARDATEETPHTQTTVTVTEDGLAVIDADGVVTVIDSLAGAERVNVGFGTRMDRVVWPLDSITIK